MEKSNLNNSYEIEISGIVDLSDNEVTLDEFSDKFLKWIEWNNWSFGGGSTL